MRTRHVIAMLGALALVASACDQPAPKPEDPGSLERTSASDAPAPEPVVAPATPDTTAKKTNGSMLWVHRSDAGDVYLFGTVHVAVDQKELHPAVWEALDGSKTFVMETDLQAASGSLMAAATFSNGRTLEDELGAEGWTNLRQVMGPSLETYKGFKPWFIISTLIPQMLPDGEDPNARLDPALASRAASKGLTSGYLESPSDQIAVLDATMNASELNEMTSDWGKVRSDLAELLRAYRAGDVAALEASSFKDLDRKPELYEKLFFERNRNWAPQFEKYIKEPGQDFIAVGAGHIIAKGGMLDLMAKRGYTFERVSFTK